MFKCQMLNRHPIRSQSASCVVFSDVISTSDADVHTTTFCGSESNYFYDIFAGLTSDVYLK